MHSIIILRPTVLAILLIFISLVSSQTPSTPTTSTPTTPTTSTPTTPTTSTPTTPNTSTPTTPTTPIHHKGRTGRQRRNAARFFGFTRSNDSNWVKDQAQLEKEFLHAHNWVRNQYHLPNLTWNETLAGYARQYLVTHRDKDCQLIHSTANYGENLFWGKKLHWTPSDAVYYWYVEKDAYNFNTRKCAPEPKMCGHFTQLVWRDSTRFGCALHHCSGAGTGMLMACEYDPPGNYPNENPLEIHQMNG